MSILNASHDPQQVRAIYRHPLSQLDRMRVREFAGQLIFPEQETKALILALLDAYEEAAPLSASQAVGYPS